MTVAEMMKVIGFAAIDVLVVTPAGRINCHFDTDHVSEDKDIFYFEDTDGYAMELDKNSTVKVEDGIYSINRGDCLFCIKLSV